MSSNGENFCLFERIEYKKERQMNDYHIHDIYELYYLVKGKVSYFVGNEIFNLKAGDMLITPPNTYHKTNYDDNLAIERILFAFPKEYINPEYLIYINELEQVKHIQFPKDQLYKIQEIIKRFEHEHNRRADGYENMKKAMLSELLIMISRLRMRESKTKFSHSYKTIQEAVQYISTNYSQDLTLSCLAKRFAMSPTHFSSQFKKITGVGMNDYLNITRIVASEKLLETTDLPITKIAMECGFNDSNYFAAVFKKIKGITPKKFSLLHKKTVL